jgi:Tol biopolymer transport system component
VGRAAAFGTLLTAVLVGCGSATSLPRNGKIATSRDGILYVMNPDGSGLRKVSPAQIGPAFWTPDRRWLVYNVVHPIIDSRASYFRADLWLLRPDGTGRHLVARNAPLGPVSPDGKTMVYANDSCLPGGPPGCEASADNAYEIYTIHLDGKGRRRLTHNGTYDGDPSWSPDGKQIVFATDKGIRIMDRDGRHVRALTRRYRDAWPQWSPRGDRILVSTGRGLALVSVGTGRTTFLKPGPVGPPDWGAAWSPDGTQVAYLDRRARSWSGETPLQVWVMNADGSHRHPVTTGFGWTVPSWASAP